MVCRTKFWLCCLFTLTTLVCSAITHAENRCREWSREILDIFGPVVSDGKGGLSVPTNHGVFVSSDNGKSWASTPISERVTYGLTSDGRGALFAGTHTAYYRRAHGSKKWIDITINEDNPMQNGGSIYPVVEGKVLLGTRQYRLFRSSDQGKSWSTMTGLPERAKFNYSPFELFGKIYLPLSTNGKTIWVYESSDNGKTWVVSQKFAAHQNKIRAIRADNNNDIYIIVHETGNGDFYKSTRDSSEWTKISTRLNWHDTWLTVVNGELYSLSGMSTLLKFSYQSKWKECKASDDYFDGNYGGPFMSYVPGGLMIATNSGIYRSTDGGVTWMPASGGLPKTQCPLSNVPIRLVCSQ